MTHHPNSDLSHNPVPIPSEYPMFVQDYSRKLSDARRMPEYVVIRDVKDRLGARSPGQRDEAGDNVIFELLTTATVRAIAGKDYQFAIDLFHKCFELVRAYEEQANCEVHKGAMTFNVALAYLWANDFPAAMHYFEFAQQETRETKGDKGWGLYDSKLFEANFWSAIDRYQQECPLTFYADFWGTPFGAAEARQTWRGLSDHSKLLYIMVNAERIRYRDLTQNGHPSQSFSLSHWNLIANLSRLIETELRERVMAAPIAKSHTSAQDGLLGMILQIDLRPLAGLKTEVNRLYNDHLVKDTGSYNTHFPAFRTAIMDASLVREKRIAAAVLFAGITRNQVQHRVDTGMVLFTDRHAATFTADVLLSLSCLDRWARP